MKVKETARKIRRAARRLRQEKKELEELQAAIAAPSAAELEAMAQGERAVTSEAHLIGVLEASICEVENLQWDLRYGVSKRGLRQLEKDWQQGKRPHAEVMQRIRMALGKLPT